MDLDELARKAGVWRNVSGLRGDGEPAHYFEAWPEELAALVNEVLEEAAKEVAARAGTMSMFASVQEARRHTATIVGCVDAIRSLKLK